MGRLVGYSSSLNFLGVFLDQLCDTRLIAFVQEFGANAQGEKIV
jgi:hypothetical protein